MDARIEQGKHFVEWAATGTVAGALMGWVPLLLAIPAAIYHLVLLYQTKTVQRWLRRRKRNQGASNHGH